jgi:antitoxin (DNA-binding transcriptional repressor) of toxin-antitoxin stability system
VASLEPTAAGGEVIIAKSGKPKPRLVPLAERTLRERGGWEGKVWPTISTTLGRQRFCQRLGSETG